MNGQEDVCRILFAISEADPIVKVGGLGDVAGSLPYALKNLSLDQTGRTRLDIRLVLPFHPIIRTKLPDPPLIRRFKVPCQGEWIEASVYHIENKGLTIYLIDGEPISREAVVYSRDAVIDGEKYTFFSMAILELARALNWPIDILHANDWHTALAVHMLKQQAQDSFFKHTRSLLVVHNLPFMGSSQEEILKKYQIPASDDPALPWWAHTMPLPMGLAAADHIAAVSPTYATEITTEAFGCGLQEFLQSSQAKLSGILNGLDFELWNPAQDTRIAAGFDRDHLDERQGNKAELQRLFSLPVDPKVPLYIMVTRMDRQKGIDLALRALWETRDLPWQAILLGTGDSQLEEACNSLASYLTEKVRVAIRFDANLARQMYAGGDLLLMPSRYEPCGLAQMISMRYGCVPVAHATGGLKDSIISHFDQPELSTGFLFSQPTVQDLSDTLRKVNPIFQNHATWEQIQRRGMEQDFSWHRSALEYVHVYNDLLKG